jgi:E3 ubiquitin-protein ligase RNF14
MADEVCEREEELETLQAIYSDLVIQSDGSAYIELPVSLDNPLPIISGHNVAHEVQHTVLHLPPLRLTFTIPLDYPAKSSPAVKLESEPPWLPTAVKDGLEAKLKSLWEDMCHEPALFAYIDDVREVVHTAFGLGSIEVPKAMITMLLDHDRKATRQDFENGTYYCEPCLEHKKGTACYRMERCGHDFCVECLQSYYNAAIAEGNVHDVKCLAYQCGMENDDARTRRSKKVHLIAPRELLQIPMERVAVARYVKIKRKKALEADKSNVWCPLKCCRGLARTEKYPKHTKELEDMEVSDLENDKEPQNNISPIINKMVIKPAMNKTTEATGHVDNTNDKNPKDDPVAICEDCGFAFCKVCKKSWHGAFDACYSTGKEEKISAEEQASEVWIRTNSSPCPRCETPIIKISDCNHICCNQCYAHFCYLCSGWLDKENPYAHFNAPDTPCDGKLWVAGEENEEGVQFHGARGAEIEARRLAEEERRQREEEAERRRQQIREEFERKLSAKVFTIQ